MSVSVCTAVPHHRTEKNKKKRAIHFHIRVVDRRHVSTENTPQRRAYRENPKTSGRKKRRKKAGSKATSITSQVFFFKQ